MSEKLEKGLAASLARHKRPGVDVADKLTGRLPGVCVVLSVRRDTGPAFRFEWRARAWSRQAALIEAEKAARDQGLAVWCTLDIIDE